MNINTLSHTPNFDQLKIVISFFKVFTRILITIIFAVFFTRSFIRFEVFKRFYLYRRWLKYFIRFVSS